MITLIIKIYLNFQLDPLDPLTEIINSGQAFSPLIATERITWLMIGVLFLGAISKSIKTSISNKNTYGHKTDFNFFKFKCRLNAQ